MKIKYMEIFAEMQSLKNLESNLALLVDFKIRIKADFYINKNQVHLCSHNRYSNDKIDDSRIRLNRNTYKYDGCIWIVHQNGKFLNLP